ncbi:MAG: iron-containing alcohol dehydrogenase [Spirochaetaceae bacterium]
MPQSFYISRTPELYFGAGGIARLPELLRAAGWNRVFVVTGGGSVRKLPQWERLVGALEENRAFAGDARVSGEPSPELVDEIAATCRMRVAEAIIGIGGGSALDTAKATAFAVLHEGSVADYLEGVGTKSATGRRLPFVACPTTAGTGTEATWNAVLRRVGPGGFKKSLRHHAFVPDLALIDPELALAVPRHVTAASGLDAVTQNLEAYVSTGATPYTDALALNGLEAAGRSFLRVLENGNDLEARGEMAWCAHTSGIALANAGLGLVHGAAGPAGATHDIPHGTACGLLLPAVTSATIARLRETAQTQRDEDDADRRRQPAPGDALARYARAGVALTGADHGSIEKNCDVLIATLERFLERAELPSFGAYGFTRDDIRALSEKAGHKKHPVSFGPREIEKILATAL